MKRFVFILFAILAFQNGKAQDNPFEELGYTPRFATLSNGKYQEFHDNDTIVNIGSVLLNTKTKEIIGFIEYEVRYSEATLEPDIVSRWISPDPLAEEFPDWSPYNFVENSPIVLSDPTGLYPVYFATKIVNEDNPDQVIDIDDGYDFTFYVNQEEFDEIAGNNNEVQGTSSYRRWFAEAVAYEMRKPESNHWMDKFLQWLIYDDIGDAIDNTANEKYTAAVVGLALSRLKPGKAGYKLVKKLSKYGKKGKIPTPDLNPEQFERVGKKRIHKKTGAIFEKSHTSHGNPGNKGTQWKAWPKGTKDFGPTSKSTGTRVTIDYDGNIVGN